MKITTYDEPTIFEKTCDCNAPIVITSTNMDTGAVHSIEIHSPDLAQTVYIDFELDGYADDIMPTCAICGSHTSPSGQERDVPPVVHVDMLPRDQRAQYNRLLAHAITAMLNFGEYADLTCGVNPVQIKQLCTDFLALQADMQHDLPQGGTKVQIVFTKQHTNLLYLYPKNRQYHLRYGEAIGYNTGEIDQLDPIIQVAFYEPTTRKTAKWSFPLSALQKIKE